MKAVIYQKYGGPEVLILREVPKPMPGDNELLVRIIATSVTAGDVRMRSFDVPKKHWIFARFYLGLFGPKRQILGMELSGVVEAAGKNVTRFKVGDSVYASTMQAGFGGYAEYKCLPETAAIALKPETLSYTEAATLPVGAVTALRLLRKGKIAPGQKVMIYGASGSVGTYAVQLAKAFGAHVTGISGTSNMELVRSLGADKVIDYTKKEFVSDDRPYDLIFDAVGKLDRKTLKGILKQGSIFVSVSGTPGTPDANDLLYLNGLVESGKLKPFIDREYSLDELVEAHRYVDTRHKIGNVAIRVVHI
jgi:NADPH:quinone reductase-like Zn-dependent oxidoreductase